MEASERAAHAAEPIGAAIPGRNSGEDHADQVVVEPACVDPIKEGGVRLPWPVEDTDSERRSPHRRRRLIFVWRVQRGTSAKRRRPSFNFSVTQWALARIKPLSTMGNTHGDHRRTIAALEEDILRVQLSLGHGARRSATAEPGVSEEVLHAGYLRKQGEGFFEALRWRKRWFVVARSLLLYYADEEACQRADKPLGAFKYDAVISVTALPHGTDIHLEVGTSSRRRDHRVALFTYMRGRVCLVFFGFLYRSFFGFLYRSHIRGNQRVRFSCRCPVDHPAAGAAAVPAAKSILKAHVAFGSAGGL